MVSERWTPAIAAAAERRHALMDTTDQVKQLRKTLAKRKKAELIEVLAQMAGQDRCVLRNLQGRFGDNCSTDQLIRATRQAIADATEVDESQRNYNFDCDCGAYETIEQNLTLLTDQGEIESAMELALELMEKGSYQVESSDEGMMTEEIQNCIQVVINALKKSELTPKRVSEWSGAMSTADRVGFICDNKLALLGKQLAG